MVERVLWMIIRQGCCGGWDRAESEYLIMIFIACFSWWQSRVNCLVNMAIKLSQYTSSKKYITSVILIQLTPFINL